MEEYTSLKNMLKDPYLIIPDHSIYKNEGDSFKYSTMEELNNTLKERGYDDLAEPTQANIALMYKADIVNGNFNKAPKILNKYHTVEDYLCITYPVLTSEQRKARQEKIEAERIKKEARIQSFRQASILEEKRRANLPVNQQGRKFSTITIDDSNRKIIQAMERYLFSIQKGPMQNIGFFLHGKPGTGKTTLLCAFANEYLEQGGTVYFQHGVSLVSDVINNKDLMDTLTQRGFLIIDDITQNIGKDFYVQTLFDIVDKRLNNNLLTCITSNISIDKMIYLWKQKTPEVERLDALKSRLKTLTVEVEINGTDRRQNLTLDDLTNRDI